MAALTPQTREEHFLARIAGDPNALVLEPVTRIEHFLQKIIDNGPSPGPGGEVTPASVVTATGQMTAQQAEATLGNIGGEPKKLTVIVTESSGSYTADKTFAQMWAAYHTGKKTVSAAMGDGEFVLSEADPSGMAFVSVSISGGTATVRRLTVDENDDWAFAEFSSSEEGGSGLTDAVKQALLDCFAHVIWKDDQGPLHIGKLAGALYPPASISAVYTQSGPVYDTDSLDSLKTDLVVTATLESSETIIVTAYTLSGELSAGTSTITVGYGGKTATFTVTVTGVNLPEGYTRYDYIKYIGATGTGISSEKWITLNDQTDLSALALRMIFAKLSEITAEIAIIGVRNSNNATTSMSVYLTTSANGSGCGVYLNGEKVYTTEKVAVGLIQNVLTLDAKSASPGEVTLNGVTDSISYGSTVVIPHGFTLFTNPIYTGATAMWMCGGVAIGAICLTKQNGDVAGYYVPCVHDGKIGVYDGVSQQFYSTPTAKYATIGDVDCMYAVGDWE